jgi:hypothetical protein
MVSNLFPQDVYASHQATKTLMLSMLYCNTGAVSYRESLAPSTHLCIIFFLASDEEELNTYNGKEPENLLKIC